MPSEFHCPLLEDDCITVKHITQEERVNAIEFVQRNRLPIIYNNVSNIEYNEYGWYCAMQYEYNPVRVVETKYYHDFDLTIQGTSYDGMHTETINVSGNLLRIRKGIWSESNLLPDGWGYYLQFGVLGADREPAKFTRCGWALVEIAPEYYGNGFEKQFKV